MGEMTIKELNSKYGTSFQGTPCSITVSEPYKEDKIIHRLYVKCGDYYFPKNFQILDKSEKSTMNFDTRMF